MAANSFQVNSKDNWFQPNSHKSLRMIFSSRNFQVWGFTKPRSDPKEGLDALVEPDTNAYTLGPSCLCRALLHHNRHTQHLRSFSPPAHRYTASPLGPGSLLLSQCSGGEGKNYQKICEGPQCWRMPPFTELHSEPHNVFSTTLGSRSDFFFFFFHKLSKPPKVTQLEGGRGKIYT